MRVFTRSSVAEGLCGKKLAVAAVSILVIACEKVVDPPEPPAQIVITPPLDTLAALGRTTQFAAQVLDAQGKILSGKTVTWSTSDASIADVTSGGLARAVSPGTATITATHSSLTADATLVVHQVPIEIIVSAARATILVNETAILEADVRDAQGNSISSEAFTIAWSTTDPSVFSVDSRGIVRGLAAGTASVSAMVGALVASIDVTVLDPLPTPDTTTVSGTVEVPAAIEREAVYVAAGVTGSVIVDTGGGFDIPVQANRTGTLLAMTGDDIFGIAIVPPQGTAIPGAARPPVTAILIGSRSTAISLIYLSPLFLNAPTAFTAELLSVIDELPQIDRLAAALEQHVTQFGVLPDSSDAVFGDAYVAAMAAANARIAELAEATGGGPSAPALPKTLVGSGIHITIPEFFVTTSTATILQSSIENWFARYSDLYVTPADTSGQRLNPFPGSPLGGRHALAPADFTPDLLNVFDWYKRLRDLSLRRLVGIPYPKIVDLEFRPQSSRFLLYAYGLGVVGVSEDLEDFAASEFVRLAVPAGATVLADIIIPILQTATGLTPKPDLPRVVTEIAAATLRGIQISRCLTGGTLTSVRFNACAFNEVLRTIFSTKEVAQFTFGTLLPAIFVVDPSRLEVVTALAVRAWPLLKLYNIISGLADFGATLFAVLGSELRHEFDLSYNRLLGAHQIRIVSGNNQVGFGNGALANPLIVKVMSEAGLPVENAWVGWITGEGHGMPSQAFDTTAADGLATVQWTPGSEELRTQTMTAVITGTGDLVEFTATVISDSIIDLGMGSAFGINDLGQVVGQAGIHAVLWENDSMIDLGFPDGGVAEDVNEFGQVVGTYTVFDENGFTLGRPFLWENGSVTDLGTLGREVAVARAVNDLGQVVGYTQTSFPVSRPFLWENGTMIELGTLGGHPLNNTAFDVNNLGQIVGQSTNALGIPHAILWENGTMIDLGEGTAYGINNLGQVVGGNGARAFLWENGTIRDLGTLGGFLFSTAHAVNDLGQIVGQSTNALGITHAFLWENGTMVDLGVLEGTSSFALDVNEFGQVVGGTQNETTFESRAVLWNTNILLGGGPATRRR